VSFSDGTGPAMTQKDMRKLALDILVKSRPPPEDPQQRAKRAAAASMACRIALRILAMNPVAPSEAPGTGEPRGDTRQSVDGAEPAKVRNFEKP
jgi:hypothetical protein